MADLAYTKGQPLPVSRGRPVNVKLPDSPDHPPTDGPTKVKVQLHDDAFAPLAGLSYELAIEGGESRSGKTDQRGWLTEELPAGTKKVTVKYESAAGDEVSRDVYVTGAAAGEDDACDVRLRNLGFDAPSRAERCIRFQGACGLPITGELDRATKAKLAQIVDGDDAPLAKELG